MFFTISHVFFPGMLWGRKNNPENSAIYEYADNKKAKVFRRVRNPESYAPSFDANWLIPINSEPRKSREQAKRRNIKPQAQKKSGFAMKRSPI